MSTSARGVLSLVFDTMETRSSNDRLAVAVAELVAALREAIAGETQLATPDTLLSIDEAAGRLGFGRTRLYTEISSGRLRTLMVGRRRLVPSAAIAEFIRAQEGHGGAHTTSG